MINSSELRIGNYLFSHKNLVRIIEITKIGFSVEPVDNFKTGWIRDFNIEPIPLTPEILERCGFDDNDLDWKKDQFVLDSESRFHIVDSTGYGTIISRNVRYLHELQNLIFSLTKQELEIKKLQTA